VALNEIGRISLVISIDAADGINGNGNCLCGNFRIGVTAAFDPWLPSNEP
jgi:hypothetical protein